VLIRGNGEGEVSGDSLDLGLFLLMIIDKMKKTGDMNTPPGTMSSSSPIANGIHHVFEFWDVWAFGDSLLGIRGFGMGFG